MKKTILFLSIVLALLAFACSKRGIDNASVTISAHVMSSNKVTSADILNYLLGIKGLTPTKAADVSVEPILCGADTVLFLVNYEDGWEILSGDSRLSRTLISSKTGHTTMPEIRTNPMLSSYIDDLAAAIAGIESDDSFRTPTAMKDSWDQLRFPGDSILTLVPVLIQTDVLEETEELQNHLLQTSWGQGSPWNQYAPYTSSAMTSHCYTGCTPVAASQLLYFLHYKIGIPDSIPGTANCTAYLNSPTDSLQLTTHTVTFSDYSTSHWADMPLNSANPVGADKVSALMVRIGFLHAAHYKLDATSASLAYLYNDYPYYFGISCSFDVVTNNVPYDYIQTVRNQVYLNQMPVAMSVAKAASDTSHAIVIDGYKYLYRKVKYTYGLYEATLNGHILPFQNPVRFIYTTEEEESTSVAINWGWDGSYDSDENGNPIWYNAFGDWIVCYTFDRRKVYYYGFHATGS